jgi:hypothetical protein
VNCWLKGKKARRGDMYRLAFFLTIPARERWQAGLALLTGFLFNVSSG